jgi:hypothetical protein
LPCGDKAAIAEAGQSRRRDRTSAAETDHGTFVRPGCRDALGGDRTARRRAFLPRHHETAAAERGDRGLRRSLCVRGRDTHVPALLDARRVEDAADDAGPLTQIPNRCEATAGETGHRRLGQPPRRCRADLEFAAGLDAILVEALPDDCGAPAAAAAAARAGARRARSV